MSEQVEQPTYAWDGDVLRSTKDGHIVAHAKEFTCLERMRNYVEKRHDRIYKREKKKGKK